MVLTVVFENEVKLAFCYECTTTRAVLTSVTELKKINDGKVSEAVGGERKNNGSRHL